MFFSRTIKKRFFIALCGLQIFLAFPFAPAHAASFTDVPETSKYYAPLEYLKQKGIISGYNDKTFKPEAPINRAEAVKVLLLAAQPFLTETPTVEAKSPFSDVSSQDWFFESVLKAHALKYVQGYEDKTFKPGNTINLAESMKVIFTALQAEIPSSLETNPYPDIEKTLWFAPFAEYGKQKNLLDPEGDGKLHPEKQMTRGQFAEIIYRLLYMKEAQVQKFPLHTNWPILKTTNYFEVRYPLEWQTLKASDQLILWKKDEASGQISFARVFPNSGTVIIALDPNAQKLNLEQYFARILYDKSANIERKTINNYPVISASLPANGLKDFYLELPNKMILTIYTQVGSGDIHTHFQNQIEAIVESIRYDEKAVPVTKETILKQIREKLLVEGAGKTILQLVDDEVIFETDTIGVGTGPVDYYFSEALNVTLKYERNSDTFLNMKEGKTSAF